MFNLKYGVVLRKLDDNIVILSFFLNITGTVFNGEYDNICFSILS